MSTYNKIFGADPNRDKYSDALIQRNSLPFPHQADVLRQNSYYDENDGIDRYYDEIEHKNIKLERKKQYFTAFGIHEMNKNAMYSLCTQLGFIYFGAMIQARKQFIPGFLFFRNSHYNWIVVLSIWL